jgi:uncharacterized protein YpmB
MRKLLIGTVAALAVGTAGASLAGESQRVVPKALDGVSSETIRTTLESMGYRVDRVEAEHDYWEVQAVNDSGLPIKTKYDFATGELIRAKLR